MKKKTPPPKKNKERYLTTKTLRWNTCLEIARTLYHSKISEANLKIQLETFIDQSVDQCY